MKRYASIFMIFLAVFQFYSCTKDMTNPPIVTNNPTLNFTYLDETRNPVERRTDKIAMKLDNPESENILMMSEKSGENEYTTYITDEKTGYVISFVYKNNVMFPEYINVSTGTDIIFGATSKHRETEDFDIVWRTGDDVDTFINIPLKNTIYSYTPYKQLDSTENYQVKNIMTSLKIWAAISGYIETSIPDSMARGWSWKNFWKAVAAVFIIVVTIIVVAVLWATQPVLATVLAVVLIPVGVGLLASAAQPGKKVITIKNRYEENPVKNGDTFVLIYNEVPALNIHSKLYLSISSGMETINKFSIKAGMEEGTPNSYTVINAYFKMYAPDTTYRPIDDKYYFLRESSFTKNSLLEMKVEKINEDENFKKRVYISLETEDDDVFMNDNVTKNFRIYITR